MSEPDGTFQFPCLSRRMGRLKLAVFVTTLESFSNSASRIHIAVLTALAFLMASMPQIPHFTHASYIWLLLSRMSFESVPVGVHQGQCLH